jgi:hypothetical protein
MKYSGSTSRKIVFGSHQIAGIGLINTAEKVFKKE